MNLEIESRYNYHL